MKRKQKTYKPDLREKEDICRRIGELAVSYTPEWRFTLENPDIGSVIGILFTGQFQDNINRFNQVIYNYHTEFVNILGISLLPSSPACATVLMSLTEDTIPGTTVRKGTNLYTSAEEEGEESVIFETAHEIYLTNSMLTDAFMVSGHSGCLIPLLGEMPPVSYVEPETETEEEGAETGDFKPFHLFSFRQGGIERNALLFYHRILFDVGDNDILVRLEGSGSLLKGIETGEFRFLYYGEDGIRPVESCRIQEDTVILNKRLPEKKVIQGQEEYSLLILEAVQPVRENIELSYAAFCASGGPAVPEYTGDASRESEPDRCLVFGNELGLYKECYIGSDFCLTKKGALVTLSWNMEFEEHITGIPAQQEEENLRTIKRKPKNISADTPADARADEIVIEYYNGFGWKRLGCREDYRRIFQEVNAGSVSLSFYCPEDVKPVEAGGYEGCCIRISLIRSDNCYMQPCRHHCPVLQDIRLSYSYEGRYQRPERCTAVYGTMEADLTKPLAEGRSFLAFSRPVYQETALYLGFDRRFENGPVSLFYEMEDNANLESIRLKYEYSSVKGFRQLKVADTTGAMTSSGMVRFLPPPDMTETEMEGKRRHWIKVSPFTDPAGTERESLPQIRRILTNAVEVYNIETLDEEEYFMDEVRPNMVFDLGAERILHTQIWVNESESYTQEQMRRMLREQGERIRADRDFQGNIDSFYVRWDEVSDFHSSQRSDRHYVLDRLNGRVAFGDGMHVMIPQVVDGPAFRAVISCSDGQAGNVKPGRINDSITNLLFVEGITNPLQAFGGSDMESAESALERGGNLISGRRRLISEYDYIREILSFSKHIDKVRCITGRLADGTSEEYAISIVLLMKDFRNGSYSFHKQQAKLMEHLVSRCELAAAEKDLRIVEPVFMKISVEVWLEVPDMDGSFELQSLYGNNLEKYLDPIADQDSDGWDIGTLPGESQILMRLNTIKSSGVVRQMSASVAYRDSFGVHECSLRDVPNDPFAVCCSGTHRLHVHTCRE